MRTIYKLLILIVFAMPLTVFGQKIYTFDQGGSGYFDGTAWTGMTFYNSVDMEPSAIVDASLFSFSDGNVSNVFKPGGYTSGSNGIPIDLEDFPQSTDCEVVWKEYLTDTLTLTKGGMLLRGQEAISGYSPGLRQGYFCATQHETGKAGKFRFRIMRMSSATGVTNLCNNIVDSIQPGMPLWVKAIAKGSTISMSYSFDSITWHSPANSSVTDKTYKNGKVQLFFGLNTTPNIYYDNITFTDLSVAEVNLVGNNKYVANGSPQGPSTATTVNFFSTAKLTFKYEGIANTLYPVTNALPSAPGSYQVIVGAVDDTYDFINAQDTLVFEILDNTEYNFCYNFISDEVGSIPAGVDFSTGNGSTGTIVTTTGRMFPEYSEFGTGYKTTGKMFAPTGFGSLNGTNVGDLTLIPSSSYYSVVWKEYYSTAGKKKGFVLQAHDVSGYADGMKMGYYFCVLNTGTNSELRIYTADGTTGLTRIATEYSAQDPGVNMARWYRATAADSLQTLEYSTDGMSWTTGAVSHDITYKGVKGSTQIVAGLAAGVDGSVAYDYIGYKDFLHTGVKNITSETTKLAVNMGNKAIKVFAGNFDIYNIQGIKVKAINNNDTSNTVTLNNGVYIVKSGMKVQRIIIQ
jgi:hypothetical protein